jgi:hypothetical protein
VSQGSVTFRMEAPSVDAGYRYVFSFGNPGDGVWWYSLATAYGQPVPIFFSDLAICNSCGMVGVPIGAGCAGVPEGGATATWDGTVITGTSTCGWSPGPGQATQAIACQSTQCSLPGEYVVTMCAERSDECFSNSTDAGTACVAVPFSYPTTTEVVGVLPP